MYRIRHKDGEVRWVRERASGVYDSEGNLLFIDGFIQDITESQKNDEQIRASLREKEALLKEIHHRVKNNLQIVTSLLNLQVDRLSDPAVVSELRESQNRVRSMALVHETLYTTGNLGRINLAEYVHALCRHLFRSFGVDSSNIRLVLDVATISLDLERTIPFGLIINELVSNALKYAFKPGKSGEIVVSLSRQSNENYVLRVKDDGIGFGDDFDIEKATSLGLKLIEDLTHQLSGTLAVSRGKGAAICITFPIGASE
jgi:two-component sensor histidine kinase